MVLKIHYFLGLEVSYIPEGIVLSQKKLTAEHLQVNHLFNLKTAPTPLPPNCKLSPKEGEHRELLTDSTYYRAMVGKINFLTHTRPNLNFTAQTLSQFMLTPRTSHLQALRHALRYVQGTIGQMHSSQIY